MKHNALFFSCAALITFSLFYFMYFLTDGQKSEISKLPPLTGIDFVRIKPQTVEEVQQQGLKEPPDIKPPPKMPSASPPKPANPSQLSQSRFDLEASLELPAFKLTDRPLLSAPVSPQSAPAPSPAAPAQSGAPETAQPNFGADADGDVIPLVRVEPEYPRNAARKGVEGWVKVEFTILPDGTVADVKVIDSEPRRIFDREAVRAVLKWKFRPRIADGKAVAQRATQTIEFKLAGG